jgi:hypothetical protein
MCHVINSPIHPCTRAHRRIGHPTTYAHPWIYDTLEPLSTLPTRVESDATVAQAQEPFTRHDQRRTDAPKASGSVACPGLFAKETRLNTKQDG